ncbi:MAG: hypothetical protein ACI9DC_004940 [Gammaproteobacteria bacterium]|jgi:hypothetical protein
MTRVHACAVLVADLTVGPVPDSLRNCHEITSPIRSLLRAASGVARRLNTGPSYFYGLPSRALLTARNNNLDLGLVISRQSLRPSHKQETI